MRIRKNAKLSGYCVNGGSSSVFYGVDDSFQTTMTTHVCQLNQSPWDVISFASDYSPFQFDGDEDSFITGNGNGSLADSYGAFQSVATMMDGEDQNNELLLPKKEEDNNMVVEVLDNIETTSFCEKTDGKNWHCKKEAKQGESLCDHHLSLLRSYNNNTNTSPSSKTRAAGARRGKARASAKKASSSSSGGGGGSSGNPYEFYYYSGFGPLWGKSRRGDKNINNDNDNNDNDNGDGGMRSNDDDHKSNEGVENSVIREEEDIIEEEGTLTLTHQHVSSSSSSDEEEEGEDNGGKEKKKRMRKPVKARSLKSLM